MGSQLALKSGVHPQKSPVKLTGLFAGREAPGALTAPDQTLKLEPQPQVVEALGFLMTNWAPSKSSL